VARASREEFVSPPNERALWLRIRNSIESEQEANVAATAAVSRAGAASFAPRKSFWSRLMSKRWEFSLPQMAAAVSAIAVTVALVTAMGIQRVTPTQVATPAQALADRARSNAFASEAYYPQGYLQPHQVSINYWQQRVEQRKASWNPRMRDSFERSLNVLDQSVNESLNELRENPHDEVAEEMLNSALRDKIELLREFCEN
jgi:DNA anti-recombination protein RmuC